MEVRFYGSYRELTGERSVTFPAQPGATLGDLLRAVTGRFPALQGELLDPRGALYPNLPIFLNGRNPRLLPGGLRLALQPGDVLSIFTPFTSGKINVEDVNSLLTSQE